MKRIVLFPTILMVVLFIAVFSTYAAEKTTITWITSAQPNTTAAKSMIADFEKETGIKVVVDEMDEVRMLEKLLMTKSSGSKPYDIVSIESTWIDMFIKNKTICPIDDLIKDPDLPVPGLDLDDYSAAAVNAQTERYGKKWMVLFGCGTSFMAVRKDWLEREGLAAPVTWDDVYKTAKKFMKDTDGDGKLNTYGVSLRGQRGIHSVFAYYCVAHPFNLTFLDKGMRPQMNSKEALDGLNMYIKLAKTGPPDLSAWTHEEATTAFVQGITGIFIDVSQLIPWVQKEIGDKVIYLPVPKAPGQPYVSVLSGWGIGVCEDSTQKKAAMKFIEYVTSKRNAKRFVEAGGSPERISILSDPGLVAKNPWYKYQLERYKVAKFAWPQIAEIPQWNDILGKYISEALTDMRTPKAAMNKANEEITAMMKKVGYFKK